MASQPAPLTVSVGTARARLASDDRRQQLLACAIGLFAKGGFSGTRTKDIAAACGVSEGILFRHFATKEDLYRAILASHADDAGACAWAEEMKRCATARDDRALLQSLVNHVLCSFRDNAPFHRLMLYAWLEGHPLAAMVEQQMGMPTFTFLRKYVATRQKEGAFRVGDPAAQVLAIYAPALQFGLNKYLFAAPWARGSDDVAAGEFTEFLLAGLRAQAAPDTSDQRKTGVRKVRTK
jgi:TetR/AcrR family transcriptional regulator